MICNPKINLRWCSTVVVQLIRNQQVEGSIPSTSSKDKNRASYR